MDNNKIKRTFMTVGKEKRQTVKVFLFEIVRRNSGILSKPPRKSAHPFESKSFHRRSPSRTKVKRNTDLRRLKYAKRQLMVHWFIKYGKAPRKALKIWEIFEILGFLDKIIKYGGFLLTAVTSLPEFYIRPTWPNLVNDINPTTAPLSTLWKRRVFSIFRGQ